VAYKNYALQVLANCVGREYLKPHLTYHDGIFCFIEGLKDPHNTMGNRICAKALVGLTANDSSLKARVIAEIAGPMKMAALNEHDQVVGSYLRVLLAN